MEVASPEKALATQQNSFQPVSVPNPYWHHELMKYNIGDQLQYDLPAVNNILTLTQNGNLPGMTKCEIDSSRSFAKSMIIGELVTGEWVFTAGVGSDLYWPGRASLWTLESGDGFSPKEHNVFEQITRQCAKSSTEHSDKIVTFANPFLPIDRIDTVPQSQDSWFGSNLERILSKDYKGLENTHEDDGTSKFSFSNSLEIFHETVDHFVDKYKSLPEKEKAELHGEIAKEIILNAGAFAINPAYATASVPARALSVGKSIEKLAKGALQARSSLKVGDVFLAPKQLAAFPNAQRVRAKSRVKGSGGLRPRYLDKKGKIYEWDSRHGCLNAYDKTGKHLGKFDHLTGEMLKPAIPGRWTSL